MRGLDATEDWMFDGRHFRALPGQHGDQVPEPAHRAIISRIAPAINWKLLARAERRG
jgi:hypothetical protein